MVVMHNEGMLEGKGTGEVKPHRKKLTYYAGSSLFGIGIAILAIGISWIVFFKINYFSPREDILFAALFLGIAIVTILVGINLMMRQSRYGYGIVTLSTLLSFGALSIFAWKYPKGDWIYPLVSYVLISYIMGFLLLMGNAFANVILTIISSNSGTTVAGFEPEPEVRRREYSEEEIEKDIDEALKSHLEIAAAELRFKEEDFADIKLGRAFRETPGTITRVKDDIDEVHWLKKAINQGDKEEDGSQEIDDISVQLDKIIDQQSSEKGRLGKHKRFRLFS
jgi:hypothetical protein